MRMKDWTLLLDAHAPSDPAAPCLMCVCSWWAEVHKTPRSRHKCAEFEVSLNRMWCSQAVCRTPKCKRYYDLVDVLAYPRHSMRLTELVTPLETPGGHGPRAECWLASDVGGHKELIRHGETGMLFKAGAAPNHWQTPVLQVLGQESLWATLRQQGRAFVENRAQLGQLGCALPGCLRALDSRPR